MIGNSAVITEQSPREIVFAALQSRKKRIRFHMDSEVPCERPHLLCDALNQRWSNSFEPTSSALNQEQYAGVVHRQLCSNRTRRHAELAVSYDSNNNNEWSKNFANGRIANLSPLAAANGFVRHWPHLIHASFGPRESVTKTASRSVQPFLRTPLQRLPMLLLFNGADNPQHFPFPLGICTPT